MLSHVTLRFTSYDTKKDHNSIVTQTSNKQQLMIYEDGDNNRRHYSKMAHWLRSRY